MNEDKIETVLNCGREKKTQYGRLNNLFEVQQFVRFCIDYRRFIPLDCENAEPLTRLTKKDVPFVCE